MLRKIAPNRDGSSEGAVLLGDFATFNGLAIPKTRHLVSGLQETPTHRISLSEMRWKENPDTSLLDGLKKVAEPKEEDVTEEQQ